MARVKQVAPIDVESTDLSTSIEQKGEEQISVVKTNTTLLTTKRLCILGVADRLMSMFILIPVDSEAFSSSVIAPSYDLSLVFLKETPLEMPHYFPIDLHGAPLFYDESIEWGEREKKLDPSS